MGFAQGGYLRGEASLLGLGGTGGRGELSVVPRGVLSHVGLETSPWHLQRVAGLSR